MTMTMRKKLAISSVAQKTDCLAAAASFTVKNRIKMCGKPTVPSINPSPSEKAEMGSRCKAWGARMASPRLCTEAAFDIRVPMSNPNSLSTMKARYAVPVSSRTALMI
jgi:hypothetical protein